MVNSKVEIINTLDNSKTLFSKEYGEHYHSLNGAFSESDHIFLDLGLRKFSDQSINILEVGYGTGLNAIMSYVENLKLNNRIYYHAIDVFKIEEKIFEQLDYSKTFNLSKNLLAKFYQRWNDEISVDEMFTLYKHFIDFKNFKPIKSYDLIYFDAFSPEIQPEMWDYENLKRITKSLNTGGMLVTYCSKGIVKQNLRDLDLIVKRFPGPRGKRHVICALKK